MHTHLRVRGSKKSILSSESEPQDKNDLLPKGMGGTNQA